VIDTNAVPALLRMKDEEDEYEQTILSTGWDGESCSAQAGINSTVGWQNLSGERSRDIHIRLRRSPSFFPPRSPEARR